MSKLLLLYDFFLPNFETSDHGRAWSQPEDCQQYEDLTPLAQIVFHSASDTPSDALLKIPDLFDLVRQA